MDNKIEGQIWIESKAPYKLKYHVANKDFAVETSEEYFISGSKLKVGDLVKVATTKNGTTSLVKASFPDDLRNVIGMLISETGAVSRSGYVTIPASYIQEGFTAGKSLYWLPEDGSYNYNYSLTDSDTITYRNLPFIGTIVSVNGDNAVVHLNMSSFDAPVEWYCQILNTKDTELPVKHGLKKATFTKNNIEIDNQVAIAYCIYKDGITTFYVNPHDDKAHTYNLSGSVVYGK